MTITSRTGTHLTVLVMLGVSHLLNDMMQSLIPAAYPILKEAYALDFVQIGMITLTFQIAGALLQPVVGLVTDKRPAPYSPVAGMMFTLSGLVCLAFAQSYAMILVSVALIGIGSSIFHPEATRMARYAAGGRQGLAQGIFQVGGQAGGALGPRRRSPDHRALGPAEPGWLRGLRPAGDAAAGLDRQPAAPASARPFAARAQKPERRRPPRQPMARATIAIGLIVLTFLMFTKNTYGESFRSFYTFYLIDRFGLSIPVSADDAVRLPAGGGGRRADRRHRRRPDRAPPDHLDLGPRAAAAHADAALRRSFLDRRADGDDQPDHGQRLRRRS